MNIVQGIMNDGVAPLYLSKIFQIRLLKFSIQGMLPEKVTSDIV
jgi:hypothetical protein